MITANDFLSANMDHELEYWLYSETGKINQHNLSNKNVASK